MKVFNKCLIILIYTSIVGQSVICLVYWVLNSELTKMQLFIEFWPWYIVNLILVLLFFVSSFKADK